MQPGQLSHAPRQAKGRPFWIILAGAAMVFIGLLMASLIWFVFATESPFGIPGTTPIVPLGVAYFAAGVGYVLAGVGSFLAWLGIALRGRA